jgi:hypothetical protein
VVGIRFRADLSPRLFRPGTEKIADTKIRADYPRLAGGRGGEGEGEGFVRGKPQSTAMFYLVWLKVGIYTGDAMQTVDRLI